MFRANWTTVSVQLLFVVFVFFPSLLLSLLELFAAKRQTKEAGPGVDKEENRWYANDKPPSALENNQNLDTLQQSHNPLLQERSRRPIQTLPPTRSRSLCDFPLFFLSSSIKSLIPFFAPLVMTAEAQTSHGCFLLRPCDWA